MIDIDPAAQSDLIAERVGGQVLGIASALAIDRYAETPDQYGNGGHFFHEYPENVQLLGLSFNTALGTSGWALQGDYALHLDAPLQRAERTLIEEGLAPMIDSLNLARRGSRDLPSCPGVRRGRSGRPPRPILSPRPPPRRPRRNSRLGLARRRRRSGSTLRPTKLGTFKAT